MKKRKMVSGLVAFALLAQPLGLSFAFATNDRDVSIIESQKFDISKEIKTPANKDRNVLQSFSNKDMLKKWINKVYNGEATVTAKGKKIKYVKDSTPNADMRIRKYFVSKPSDTDFRFFIYGLGKDENKVIISVEGYKDFDVYVTDYQIDHYKNPIYILTSDKPKNFVESDKSAKEDKNLDSELAKDEKKKEGDSAEFTAKEEGDFYLIKYLNEKFSDKLTLIIKSEKLEKNSKDNLKGGRKGFYLENEKTIGINKGSLKVGDEFEINDADKSFKYRVKKAIGDTFELEDLNKKVKVEEEKEEKSKKLDQKDLTFEVSLEDPLYKIKFNKPFNKDKFSLLNGQDKVINTRKSLLNWYRNFSYSISDDGSEIFLNKNGLKEGDILTFSDGEKSIKLKTVSKNDGFSFESFKKEENKQSNPEKEDNSEKKEGTLKNNRIIKAISEKNTYSYKLIFDYQILDGKISVRVDNVNLKEMRSSSIGWIRDKGFNVENNKTLFVDKSVLKDGSILEINNGENTYKFTVHKKNGEFSFVDIKAGKTESKDSELDKGKLGKEDKTDEKDKDKKENHEKEVPQNSKLNVKIEGSFDSAISGQGNYDAVSASTGMSNNFKNSNVVVKVAYGQNPKDEDYKVLDAYKLPDVKIEGSKSRVNIDKKSGMKGFFSKSTGSLTLSGVPKDPGTYDVSVTITDYEGNEATSNSLKFKIFKGTESLKDVLKVENSEKMQDGKYLWKMEPHTINSLGAKEFTVPSEIKGIIGSGQSGTYGHLGQASEEAKETLIVGKGTVLDLKNVLVHGSVKIVVKDGGKLILDDSALHTDVIVEKGGILSSNYNEFKEKQDKKDFSLENLKTYYKTGSSVNGKILVKDGGILENAIIYSNTNWVGDGKIVRLNTEPVVEVEENAKIRGFVVIKGDEAPTGRDEEDRPLIAQPALRVKNGKLEIEKDSLLVTYGGGSSPLSTNGGSAIMLDSGSIIGNGSLVAVGGDGYGSKGRAGDGISGKGKVDLARVYTRGGDSLGTSLEELVGLGNSKDVSLTAKKLLSTKGSAIRYPGDRMPYKWADITEAPSLDYFMEVLSSSLGEEDKKVEEEKEEDSVKPNPDKPEKPTDTEKPQKPEKAEEIKVKEERIAGKDRVNTAVELSKKGFEKAETVILVNGQKEVDALAGARLADKLKAPILLIEKDNTPEEVRKEIARLGAKNVILIGGEQALGEEVKEGLEGKNIRRLAGENRFETSAKIAKELGKTDKIILANGNSMVDALAASSLAIKEERSIILVEEKQIPEEVKEIVKGASDIVIVGGEGAIAKSLEEELEGKKVERLEGENRYQTAVKIAERTFGQVKEVALANGQAYADALAFGPLTGIKNMPILLTEKENLPEDTKDYIEKNKVEKVYMVGGESRIDSSILK